MAVFTANLRRFGLSRADLIGFALLGAFMAGVILFGVGLDVLEHRGATALFTVSLVLIGAIAFQVARQQRTERDLAAAARRRAALATSLAGTIMDAEVREAWPRIISALDDDPRGGLHADLVHRLIHELERGGALQLGEETSIGMDDNFPGSDRVALYHGGFEPNTAGCSRASLVVELARLAMVLDPLRDEHRGSDPGGST